MYTFVIGVHGKARSGKDTIVKHLIETYKDQYDIRRYAFADALKIELYNALANPLDPYWETTDDYFLLPHPPVIDARLISNEDKLKWIEDNRAGVVKHLQLYGTEYRRVRDPFYWVRALAKQLRADKPMFALISDMRFQNEFLFVKANKGFTVKCVRLGFVDPLRNPNHKSETDLENALFDWTIEVPDGAVDELRSDAVTVFENIIERVTPDVPEVGDGFVAA